MISKKRKKIIFFIKISLPVRNLGSLANGNSDTNDITHSAAVSILPCSNSPSIAVRAIAADDDDWAASLLELFRLER